ncbi:porin [Xenophilus azovorans]|uniref:porin n=1 Tax=Xenophilus sp. TaxID=1873499 RepID=UPI000570B87D
MTTAGLAALAALAAAGVASAQSSVTLFGVVDAGISSYSNKSQLVTDPFVLATDPLAYIFQADSAKKSWTGMTVGNESSARLGFRGVEDLGGGLAASFWLESSIRNDDASYALNFNRRATVSLSGAFGEIRLGRDYKPTFSNNSVFDPFGTVGVGTNLIQKAAGAAPLTASNLVGSDWAFESDNVRASNSVGYFLPRNLGGFYGNVMYAFHEKAKYSDGTFTPANGDTRSGRYWGGRFGYANGPLDVAVAYGEQNVESDYYDGFDRTVKTFNVGASYDFGVLKLVGEYARVKSDGEYTNVSPFESLAVTNGRLNGYHIGLTAPVGAGVIKASYGRVTLKPSVHYYGLAPLPSLKDYWAQAFGNQGNPKADQIAVGYVHNLSKRTALYGTVAYIKNKNGADYSVGGIARGNWISGDYRPKTSIGYDLGIRHAF